MRFFKSGRKYRRQQKSGPDATADSSQSALGTGRGIIVAPGLLIKTEGTNNDNISTCSLGSTFSIDIDSPAKKALSLGTGQICLTGTTVETFIPSPGIAKEEYEDNHQEKQQTFAFLRVSSSLSECIEEEEQQQQAEEVQDTNKFKTLVKIHVDDNNKENNAPIPNEQKQKQSPKTNNRNRITIDQKQKQQQQVSNKNEKLEISKTNDVKTEILNNQSKDISTTTNKKKKSPIIFHRQSSSFLRVGDLDIEKRNSTSCSSCISDNEEDVDANNEPTERISNNTQRSDWFPNFHHISAAPPPGYIADHNELWVSLDNGDGILSPLAPCVVNALEEYGRQDICYNETMWTPGDRNTSYKITNCNTNSWLASTFHHNGQCPPIPNNDPDKDVVLLWGGKLNHSTFYGHDLPLVRAAGIIDMSPQKLVELLLDSNRIKEYNTMSLGRKDIMILQEEMYPDNSNNMFGGVTKIVRNQARPPVIRKILQFTTLFHARPFSDNSGYCLVSRAVISPDPSSESSENTNNHDIVVSEILNGINIMKSVEGNPNQCLFIAVNHVRSPLPLMIAKRIGQQAAVNFIHDLRKCCSS